MLQDIQRRCFYQLRADVSQHGRCCHEYSMAVSVTRDVPAGQDVSPNTEAIVTDALRDLARWLYHQLERDYDARTSDDAIDDILLANSFTFTAAGERFG